VEDLSKVDRFSLVESPKRLSAEIIKSSLGNFSDKCRFHLQKVVVWFTNRMFDFSKVSFLMGWPHVPKIASLMATEDQYQIRDQVAEDTKNL